MVVKVEKRLAEEIESPRKEVAELKQEKTERKQAEERVQHLNLVLCAIRSVNQVIARETDRSQLLKGICRSLTETLGYYNAWIALLDESGRLREYGESGLGDDFLPMKERLERGELTHCARRALEQSSLIMTENPPLNCSDCPLSGNYEGRGGLTTRLRHGAKCYGVMSLSTPTELLSDDEEVVLFREIAHDIAFALGSLELEERRKKAEEELEESEERYRALIEAGADMGEAIVLLQDTDKLEAAHRFANDEWARITGYTVEELREISFLDLVHPRHRDAVADRVRRRFQGELLPGFWEISIVAKDRTEVPVEAAGAPITYQGRPAIVGYMRDITERKRAEQELRESEERLRILFEFAPDACYLNDLKGNFVDGNKAAEGITGYKREELIGKSFLKLKLLSVKQTPKAAMLLAKNALGQPTGPNDFTLNRKDGSQVSVEIRTFPVRIKEQTLVLGIARDITERKKMEETLRVEKERVEEYLNIAGVMLGAVDADENITLMNKKGYEILGYKEGELTGRNWFDLLVPQRMRAEIRGVFCGLMAGDIEPVEHYENPLLTKDGEERLIAFHNTVIKNANGQIVGALLSGEDITERKRAEERLEHSFIDLAETVSRAMGFRDPYTSSHQRRVAELARLVGEKIGLDEDKLRGLYIGGLLHDIGKISTPESILSKPGELTDEEWNLVRAHAKQGYLILKGTNLPWPVADMALHHHERLDGSGYPHGISGDKLSLEVRILGVCDVVEAMSSYRPYRPAGSVAEILKEIKGGRGTKYGVDVVDIMLELIESGEFEMEGK